MLFTRALPLMRILKFLPWLSVGAVTLALLVTALHRTEWWLELLAHWKPWLVALLLMHLPFLAWRRRWLLVIIVLAVAVHGAWALSPWWVSSSTSERSTPGSTEQASPDLRLLTINLHADLADHNELMNWVLSENPDLVVVQEITARNAPTVRAKLGARYPHFHVAAIDAPFSLAILSRSPLREVEVLRESEGALPQVVARTETPSGPLTIIGVHLSPPVSESLATANRRAIDLIARRVDTHRQKGETVVVAGDFNQTPWSPTFMAFIEETGLSDPRRTRGFLPTWNPGALLGIAMLPIDHILVPASHEVVELRRGPFCGSDHRPLLAVLRRTSP